jgi:hypothetical protein
MLLLIIYCLSTKKNFLRHHQDNRPRIFLKKMKNVFTLESNYSFLPGQMSETFKDLAPLHPKFSEIQACLDGKHAKFSETHACLPEKYLKFAETHACFPEKHACLPEIHACLSEKHACFPEIHACFPEKYPCVFTKTLKKYEKTLKNRIFHN